MTIWRTNGGHSVPRSRTTWETATPPRQVPLLAVGIVGLLIVSLFPISVYAQNPAEPPLPVGTTQVIEGLRCPETLANLTLTEKEHSGLFPIDVVYHPRADSTDEFAFACNYQGDFAGGLMGTAEISVYWTTDPYRSKPYGPAKPPCDHSGTFDLSMQEALFPNIPGSAFGGGWIVSETTASAVIISVFGEPYLEPSGVLGQQLLTHVQDVAASCDPGPECLFTGAVTDAGARPGTSTRGGPDPLQGVRVALVRTSDDLELKVVATDANGTYRFSSSEVTFPSDFDGRYDPLAMRLRLQEAAHDPPRFEVIVPIDGALEATSLLSDEFGFDAECEDGLVERDFALGAIPEDFLGEVPQKDFWPDLGEIYDRVWRAWELADSIGQPLDYGLPLDIIGFCSSLGKCEGKRKTAFWTTTNSPDRDPFIAFGDDTSQLADGNWPDNREYHEFGHHFMADGFGDAMPRSPGDENHAGYYVNPSSTDSWREGWAEFYSMMVAKHVDQEIRPELYRVEGVYLNLEFDYRPWMAMGTAEELAVAGLLLDLEDGPDDYATGRQLADLRIAWHEITTDQNGRLLIGGAVNDSPTDYSEQTMVAATFHDPDGRLLHTGWVATIPWDLPFAGGEGFFSLMLPEDLEWDSLEITAIEGRPGDVLTDDDPVDLTLDEIWQTIVSFTSQQQAGNGYVFDVVDLYTAFRQRYGGRDADGNGMDDIEQLFIAHGLFADTDGDRSFLHGNEVGRTDHAALMVPGLGELLPGWIPRRTCHPWRAASSTSTPARSRRASWCRFRHRRRSSTPGIAMSPTRTMTGKCTWPFRQQT